MASMHRLRNILILIICNYQNKYLIKFEQYIYTFHVYTIYTDSFCEYQLLYITIIGIKHTKFAGYLVSGTSVNSQANLLELVCVCVCPFVSPLLQLFLYNFLQHFPVLGSKSSYCSYFFNVNRSFVLISAVVLFFIIVCELACLLLCSSAK